MEHLLERRLVFVSGKGGVGKTTVSAALASFAARRGRKVLLAEISSQPATARIFGKPKMAFEPIPLHEGVWGTNCDRDKSLVSFLTRFVRIRRVAKSLVGNRMARKFLDAAPGVLETVVLERVERMTHDDQFDFVVVDLPSSGHAVSFLDVPRAMSRLLKSGRLADHLAALADRLATPGEAELILVTQPEPLPIQETIELKEAADERLEIPVETVVINRLQQLPLSSEATEKIVSGDLHAQTTWAAHAVRLLSGWHGRELSLVTELRAALPEVQFVDVPWMPDADSELQLISRIAESWHLQPTPHES